MTMQIGVVGTDGIVLASDTLWMREDTHFGAVLNTSNASKLRIDYQQGIAIACARSMETATRVAEELIRGCVDGQKSFASWRATETANQVLEKAHPMRKEIECLIVAATPKPKLFHLHYGILDPAIQNQAICEEESRKCIAGNRTNAACFWAERYCQYLPPQPIKRLIPLVAHMIVSASVLNSAGIGGLEIVVCETSGIKRLSDDSTALLIAQSKEWDQEIGSLVMNYSKQLFYAPDATG
jgi:hypothetical protein